MSKISISAPKAPTNKVPHKTLQELAETNAGEVQNCAIDFIVDVVCNEQILLLDGKNSCYGIYYALFDHSAGVAVDGVFTRGDQGHILEARVMDSAVNGKLFDSSFLKGFLGVLKISLGKVIKYGDEKDLVIDCDDPTAVKPIMVEIGAKKARL
jgi:hypothetical protein